MAKQKLRRFISDTTPTFSFDYPIFKDWQIEILKNEIRYLPTDPTTQGPFEVPPSIGIYKPVPYPYDEVRLPWVINGSANSHGVKYLDLGNDEHRAARVVRFNLGQAYAEIAMPSDEKGLSGEIIWQTVVNSFDVNRPSPKKLSADRPPLE